MRDRKTIDSELRLQRLHEPEQQCTGSGAPFHPRARWRPSSRQVDELLDERLAHRADVPAMTRQSTRAPESPAIDD
jgi:hypothetical protein